MKARYREGDYTIYPSNWGTFKRKTFDIKNWARVISLYKDILKPTGVR